MAKTYTVKEVAQKLGVAEFTVRTYIKTGKLKAEKHPKGLKYYYLVNEADLKKFIEENMGQ